MSVVAGWAVGSAALAIFLLVLVTNWRAFFLRYVSRSEEAPTVAPLLGGLCGALGLAILPVQVVNHMWWYPFLLDAGCAPILLITFVWWLGSSIGMSGAGKVLALAVAATSPVFATGRIATVEVPRIRDYFKQHSSGDESPPPAPPAQRQNGPENVPPPK
jgi:hypothetical protein